MSTITFKVKNFVVWWSVNPWPDDKILDWSKLKQIADGKSNVTKRMISLSDRAENTVGKKENAVYRSVLQSLSKVGIVW